MLIYVQSQGPDEGDGKNTEVFLKAYWLYWGSGKFKLYCFEREVLFDQQVAPESKLGSQVFIPKDQNQGLGISFPASSMIFNSGWAL